MSTIAASRLAGPRYGTASLAEVVPSAVAALGLAEPNPLGLPPADSVVVFVVDGLGIRQLAEHAELAPFLAGLEPRHIDAAFPSTTATSLATVGTGRPPGRHGLTGYTIAHADHEQPLNLLAWNVGLRGGGFDAREAVVPEDFQPDPTALEEAERLGARVAVVLDPDFTDSGLTRAGLRGGTRVEAVGLERTLEAAVAATRGRGPNLVYAHHGDVDTMGHVHGPGSDPWRQALQRVDEALARVAERLPRGTRLLVTADHGMVGVPPEEIFELAESGLEEGVRVLAGEPRCRQLWTHDGARDDVVAAWRERLSDRAVVATREEAVAHGWFGPVDAHLRERIGEVVAVATHGTLAHRDVDPFEGRLAGQHGGLSRDELEVPLLTIGAGR